MSNYYFNVEYMVFDSEDDFNAYELDKGKKYNMEVHTEVPAKESVICYAVETLKKKHQFFFISEVKLIK